MTLMLIVGAGGSADSVDETTTRMPVYQEPGGLLKTYRPPLAVELFDDRVNFAQALRRYPACAALVGDLRTLGNSVNLEEELERVQAESDAGNELVAGELVALRFYLRDVISECSVSWHDASAGVTNYAILLRRLAQWRRREAPREDFAIATFNYDTLLERAVEEALGRTFLSFSDFVAGPDIRLLKLHGSVDWAHRSAQTLQELPLFDPHGPTALILNAARLQISPDFVRVSSTHPDYDDDDVPLLPALALPTLSKRHFEMPETHQTQLEAALQRTTRLIIIGWNATEQHFLDKWHRLAPKNPRVLVVSRRSVEDSTDNYSAQLASLLDVDALRITLWRNGFSAFLRGATLEHFLGTPV